MCPCFPSLGTVGIAKVVSKNKDQIICVCSFKKDIET